MNKIPLITFRCFVLIITALLFVLAGCGKKQPAVQPAYEINGVKVDVPKLQDAFAGAPPAILAAGVRDVIIDTGYRAEAIENYFGDGSKWKARIAYGRQMVADGTGKAPEVAREFIGASPFLLTYGDILVPPRNYRRMINRFAEDDFSGVISVTRGEDVRQGGLNFFDEAFCLKRVVEKP